MKQKINFEKTKTEMKQIIKFKEGEISLCPNCYCITKTILEKDKLICGKCRRGK
jgi:protein-arginine kinase activator protein McsA